MLELLGANWPIFAALAALALLALVWMAAGRRKTRVTREEAGADAGAHGGAQGSPAGGLGGGPRRNQALIDAPVLAVAPPPTAPPSPEERKPEPGLAAPARPAAEQGGGGDAGPDPAPASDPGTPAADGGDDLTRIKGLGPRLAEQLRAQGITRFAQIASLDEAGIDRIDATLGRFQGRIRRDQWVRQAALLAAGEEQAFAAQFGNS